jgi:hypothetical protein
VRVAGTGAGESAGEDEVEGEGEVIRVSARVIGRVSKGYA